MGPNAVQLAGGESLLPGLQLQPPPDRGEVQHLYLQSSEYLQISTNIIYTIYRWRSSTQPWWTTLPGCPPGTSGIYISTHTFISRISIHLYLQYLRVHLNLRHHFSSPWRVKEIMKSSMYLPSAVRELNIQARRVLPHFIGENIDILWPKVKIFLVADNASTTEWIEQNIQPLSEKLSRVAHVEDSLTEQDAWPRRPV